MSSAATEKLKLIGFYKSFFLLFRRVYGNDMITMDGVVSYSRRQCDIFVFVSEPKKKIV